MLPDVLAVSTFEWIKALVAPILAFIALITAAAIAAATAKNRQAQQLDHDSARLRQQLDHDSERLGKQLEHERRMADLAAVRDVVEEGAVHLHRVAYALDRVRQDLHANAAAAHDKLTELGERADVLVERFNVRLGREHEVTRTFQGADQATLDAYRAIERAVKLHLPHIAKGGEGSGARQAQTLLDKDEAIITAARARFDDDRAGFIDAAARTVGAILPPRQ